MNGDRSNWSAAEIVRYLRLMRHDFLNHLQVISGYLQLQRRDKALDYLQRASGQMHKLGELLRLQLPELSILLLIILKQVEEHQVELEWRIGPFPEGEERGRQIAALVDDLWEPLWTGVQNLGGEGARVTLFIRSNDDGSLQIEWWLSSPAYSWAVVREKMDEGIKRLRDRGIPIYVEEDSQGFCLGTRLT